MFSFVAKAKTNGLAVSDVQSRLATQDKKLTNKQKTFATLMVPIWREYERQLKDSNMLDFSDMVNLAVQVVREGNELSEKYSHILVDEFQDITDPQLELIKYLSSGSDGENTLFCVGDYRQNIFSFAGSNVHNILDFDQRFPYPEKTILSKNYRCPLNVVEASNALMSHGTMGREPRVVAASTEIHPIRLIEKDNHSRYEDWELQSAGELLLELLSEKRSDENILVLARYNFRFEELRMVFPDHAKNGLSFKSVHRAKGTEAHYVVLLGCIGGLFGFPSDVIEENLLDIVDKHRQDKNEKLEEERRLFYVALTRCKKQLYVFTSKNNRSQFLSEIEPFLNGRSSLLEQSSPKELSSLNDGYCIRCHHGIQFSPRKPLCDMCYSNWAKFKNKSYEEKFCHSCGKRIKTTYERPLCSDCSEQLNSIL